MQSVFSEIGGMVADTGHTCKDHSGKLGGDAGGGNAGDQLGDVEGSCLWFHWPALLK